MFFAYPHTCAVEPVIALVTTSETNHGDAVSIMGKIIMNELITDDLELQCLNRHGKYF